MSALSLATDLGLGRPLEHELGVCLAALGLADRLGCGAGERSEVYYVALLAHVGCTGGAPYFARWAGGDEIRFLRGAQRLGLLSGPAEDLRHLVRHVGDDRPPPERARLLARTLARGAAARARSWRRTCARRRRCSRGVCTCPRRSPVALGQLMERWDGKGLPAKLAGEQIARPARIVLRRP